ncbi:UNVERIFIED_CONTAM: hypothetical protein FKN15_051651 [Acipenser sinensis]
MVKMDETVLQHLLLFFLLPARMKSSTDQCDMHVGAVALGHPESGALQGAEPAWRHMLDTEQSPGTS